MSAARIFLLLVSVAAVESRSSCEVQRGVALLSTYGQCLGEEVQEMPLFQTIFITRDPSMEDIRNFVQDMCTEAIPKATRCLDGFFSGCNATVREAVSHSTATGVGFMCQPGGAGPEPVIISVLNSISDEDLEAALIGGCPNEIEADVCSGHIDFRMDRIENMPRDTLVSLFQRSLADYIQCWARRYKEKKDTCSYWRAAFMLRVSTYLIRAIPGTRFPFTADEMADLLEI